MNILTTARTAAAAASLGVVSANPIGIAVGIAGIASFALLRVGQRPSTLIRIGEDAVVGVAQGATNKTRSAARAVKREYTARKIARMQQELRAQAEALSAMTAGEVAVFAADQAAINARVAELLGAKPAAKKAKAPAKKAPRAARSGRSAQA